MDKDIKVIIGTVIAGLALVALLCWAAPAKAVNFISGSVSASQAHDISADTNLIGLWYLENNGNDETVSGNTITASGAVSYGTSNPTPKQGTYRGDAGSAATDYWSISDASQVGMDTGTAISIGGWIYGDANASDGLVGKHGTSGNYGFQGLTTTSNGFEFGMSSDGTAWTSATSAINVYADNAWYHIVFVYDNSYIRLYVNGAEQTSGDFPLAYSGGWFDNTEAFYVGGRSNGATGFDGKLDEWFYTKDALTAQEISDIYNYGFTP